MKKPIRKLSFGIHAKDYQKYRRTYDLRLYKLLFSLIEKNNMTSKAKIGASADEISILDIGCGTGKSTVPLITSAPKNLKNKLSVTGIDPDRKMLIEARKYSAMHNLPIKYIEGSAEHLPFKKETFDAIIAGTAFHWFANKKAMMKISRTLKPGGIYMIFWTWRAKIKVKPSGLAAEVLKKYNWKSIDPKWRDLENIRALLQPGGLSGFESAVIPFTEKDTVKDNVGMCKTMASYALLSPKKKREFTAELTDAYRKIIGKKAYITTKRELHICWAFKK